MFVFFFSYMKNEKIRPLSERTVFFFILGAGTQQSLFRDDKTYVSLTVIRDGRLKALAY